MSSTALASPRNLILILATSGFASTFSGRAVEPLVGLIARDLQTSVETAALLSAAFALPYAFIQPILGPFGDAVGKERVMTACLAILAVTLLASTFAPTADTLFMLRVVGGLAAGGIVPLALALMGDRIPMAQRQVAISRFLVAVISGQLAGSSLAGIMAAWIGWRGVFALSTAIMVVALGSTIAGFRRSPPGRAFDLATALQRYRDILRDPRALTLFGLVFVEAIAVFGVFPYMAPLLEEKGQGGSAEAGLALGGFAVGGLLYSALVRWMLKHLGLARMLAGGGGIAAAALVGLGLAGSWQLDATAMIVLGLGFYMLHNSFQTQVTEVAPRARASAVALHAFSFFCGQALGVVAVGAGLNRFGLVGTMMIAALLILAVGLIAAVVIPRQAPAVVQRGR
jgi:predicted MFS family arabinose efflux permease